VHLQRIQRGKAARRRVMGLGGKVAQPAIRKALPDTREEAFWQAMCGGAQEEIEADPETKQRWEAATRIQKIYRGRVGRAVAKSQVRPFFFSCGGFNFHHQGRQKPRSTKEKEAEQMEKPWLHNAKKGANKAEKALAARRKKWEEDQDPWVSLLRDSPASNSADSKQEARGAYLRKQGYIKKAFSRPEDEDMQVFRIFDRDGDGMVSKADFVKAIELLGQEGGAQGGVLLRRLQRGYFDDMVQEMDKDGDGRINPEEFISYLRRSRIEEKGSAKQAEIEELNSVKRKRLLMIARLQGKLAREDRLSLIEDVHQKKKVVAADNPRISAIAEAYHMDRG